MVSSISRSQPVSRQVKPTPHHSWCTGDLSEGCKLCVEGRKLVLFITGKCAQACFYCPISEKKFGKGDAYANEWKIDDPLDPKELIEEARLTEATGAGITGGDPLMDMDRCVKYITILKKEFGKGFHIHLYTPLRLVTKEALERLFRAGLDEIRFHPDLDDESLWGRLELAGAYSWAVGVEIPAIPGYEDKTRKLIDFIVENRGERKGMNTGNITFLNLNELELSDTEVSHYKLGSSSGDSSRAEFKPKDSISYGAKGSQEMALSVLEYAREKGLRAHYCTARLKDAVQVRQRLKRRAEGVALPFDEQTEDGLLVRGCAYPKNLAPGAGYREKLKDKEIAGKIVKEIERVAESLKQQKTIKEFHIDSVKPRILLPIKTLKKISPALKKAGLIPAIVEEYPTHDGFEVEVEFL